MIISERIQKSTDKMEQINLLTNGKNPSVSLFCFMVTHLTLHTHTPIFAHVIGTVLNDDLNCDGAVNLHITFLVLCYVLVAITFALILILFAADKEIRARRKLKHYFTHSGKDLEGDKVCSLCACVLTD
jgi:hypothetical protein